MLLVHFFSIDVSCQFKFWTNQLYVHDSPTYPLEVIVKPTYLLTESLNELEDNDLDALMADLESKSAAQEPLTSEPNIDGTNDQTAPPATTQKHEPATALPPPPGTDVSCGDMQTVNQSFALRENVKLGFSGHGGTKEITFFYVSRENPKQKQRK